MALIVESGDGLPDAESYVSVSDAAIYAAAHGLPFLVGSPESDAEAALRRATTWLDANYRQRFSGRRRNGRGQALEWPRVGASDAEDNEIADDEVPDEIVKACIEAAIRELATPGALSPDVTPNSVIASASVSGAVSVTYASGKGVDGQRPVSTVIDDILGSLIGARPGSATVGFVSRA